MLNKENFDELAKARGDCLISIVTPTHRAGPEIRQDPIRLKNLINEARERAVEGGCNRLVVNETLERAEALLEDLEFWRHQGEGLALLLDQDAMRVIRLAHPVEELVDVGDRFHVRSLLPAVSDGSTFHILALAQNSVRLFECSRSGLRQIDLHDIPTSLADALGWDVEQKSLQFHTGTSPAPGPGSRSAVFHGQGRGDDESEEELEQFLLRVDKGLGRLLAPRDRPMVIAAVERDAAKYRAVSDHPRLAEGIIEGNPEHEAPELLHDRALDILESTLDGARRQALARVTDKAHAERTVAGLEDALRGLEEARLDTLIVREGPPVWGRFDAKAGVETAPDGGARPRPDDHDLLDLAVHRAVETGATVFAAGADELPEQADAVGALRY